MRLSFLCVVLGTSLFQPAFSAAVVTTLTFDPAPLANGATFTTSLSEQGVTVSGAFNQVGTQTTGRASNDSTGVLDVANNGQMVFTAGDGQSFQATSVDLSEYSLAFVEPTLVQLFGEKTDGSIVTATFTTDGEFDGPGGVADFETFLFPADFTDLKSLYSLTILLPLGDQPFALDNLSLVQVPEPGVTALAAGGLLGLGFRRRRG